MMEADYRVGTILKNVKVYAKIYTPTLSWGEYFQIVLTDFYPIASFLIILLMLIRYI